jgi:hypothetical protein
MASSRLSSSPLAAQREQRFGARRRICRWLTKGARRRKRPVEFDIEPKSRTTRSIFPSAVSFMATTTWIGVLSSARRRVLSKLQSPQPQFRLQRKLA